MELRGLLLAQKEEKIELRSLVDQMKVDIQGIRYSFSSTFYDQLLHAQIPKAQKDSQVISLFALSGSGRLKATRRTLMKLTSGTLYVASFHSLLRPFLQPKEI